MGYVIDQLQELARIAVDLTMYLVNFILINTLKLFKMIGLKFDFTSQNTLAYILAIIILAAFSYFTLKIISKWVYNSIIGLAILIVLHLVGVNVPLNLFTIIVVALFGVGGVVALLVLHIAGVLI